ncbi:RICIN domain-containing protein [Streptomyces sp. NPDC001348]
MAIVDMQGVGEDRAGSALAPTRPRALGLLTRRGWAAIVSLGLALGLSLVNASPASAYTLGPNFLRNWETGLCLDSNAAGSVYTNPCQFGNNYQNWVVVYDHHTTYDVVKIMNVATRLYLYWSPTKPITNEYVNSGTPNYPQLTWLAKGSGWDNVELSDVDGKNLCLYGTRANGALMDLCNGSGFSKWKLGY